MILVGPCSSLPTLSEPHKTALGSPSGRQPKGQPTGGQFAAKSNPEVDIELEPSWPGLTRDVRQGEQVSTVRWRDAVGRLQDPPDRTPAVCRFRPDGTVASEAHYQDGRLQDSSDGAPALRQFRPDGTVESEEHWQAGRRQDPPDGAPALRRFHPNGSVKLDVHWQADRLQDPPDGSPARRRFRPNGTVEYEERWQDGRLVSARSVAYEERWQDGVRVSG